MVHHPIKTAIYNGLCPVDIGVDSYLIGFISCRFWHDTRTKAHRSSSSVNRPKMHRRHPGLDGKPGRRVGNLKVDGDVGEDQSNGELQWNCQFMNDNLWVGSGWSNHSYDVRKPDHEVQVDFTFLLYRYRCSNLPPCLEIWDVENKPFLVCWMESEWIVNLEMSQQV